MKPIFEAIAIILCVLIMLNKGDRRAKIYLYGVAKN